MRTVIVLISFMASGSLWAQSVVLQNDQWANDWLVAHNQWRKEVGAPPLKWNQDLSKSAEKWALKLSKKQGHLEHSHGDYGENIYWTSALVCPAAEATDAWGSEQSFYHDQKINGTNYQKFGHYTQMIWSTTTEVGCAVVSNGDKGTYAVCQYLPAGNIIGLHPYKK